MFTVYLSQNKEKDGGVMKDFNLLKYYTDSSIEQVSKINYKNIIIKLKLFWFI